MLGLLVWRALVGASRQEILEVHSSELAQSLSDPFPPSQTP
jgi:hypothetical protein